MDFTTKTLTQIPAVVALSENKLTVSGSPRDVHAWLKADNIRSSKAFIIHDSCGCLLKRYKRILTRYDYEIKVFDTTCGAESVRYNPFAYIRDRGGVTELTDAVLRGTDGNGDYDNDYGFLSAEWLLLKTLFGYIHENAADYDKNFNTVLEMLKNMETDEDWEDYKTPVDYMFESKKRLDPDDSDSTVLRYKYFKTTPYAKDNRLLESCAKRLAPLVTKQALDFMSEDELCFNELSYNKIAVFVKTDDDCSHLKFITPLMYSQFFKTAYEQAVN